MSPAPVDAYGTARHSPLLPGTFCVAADLHNHTRLSDGRGDPARAFASMRGAGLDVAALTDHATFASPLGRPGGVPLAGMLNGLDEAGWQQTRELADLANSDGSFVAIRGFEWSHPLLGHVNVWDSPEFTSPGRPHRDMRHLWDWLETEASGESLVGFNHPGSRGTVLRFAGFQFRAPLAGRLVGLEMFNKRDDYLFAGVEGGARSPLVECLAAGWRPGLTGVTDEHGNDWGRPEGKGRTGLFVSELSRAGVREALSARRTFATRLRGLRLAATLGDVPMGGSVPVPHAGRHTLPLTVDLDLGPGAVGMELSLQVLRPGATVPDVHEVGRVVSGDPPRTVPVDLDTSDGTWAVLRVSDLAGRVDDHATAAYRSLGSSVAYASPWWLDEQ